MQVADASGWTTFEKTLITGGKVAIDFGTITEGALIGGSCLLMSNACGLSEQGRTIYRTVDARELNVIQTTGTYGYNPNANGKYFALSYAGAANLIGTFMYAVCCSAVTSITIPQTIFGMGYFFPDPGGAGPSVFFSNQQLPVLYNSMSPIRVFGPPR